MQCRLFYCIMENEQRGMITFILAVCGNVDYVYSFPQSPPSRAAWIEIVEHAFDLGRLASPPSRAAWIEIPLSAIISAMYLSLHSQVVCMQRFACVICPHSVSSLIKNRVTAFQMQRPCFRKKLLSASSDTRLITYIDYHISRCLSRVFR